MSLWRATSADGQRHAANLRRRRPFVCHWPARRWGKCHPAARHVFLRFEERRFGYSANRRRIAGDAKGGNMSIRDIEKRVVQYGVRTVHSSTILVLTDSRAEAERALDMFGEGVLIERTVSYTRWRTAEADLSATG
jgi:hypothetical protein